jgi:hypothetical protein
VDELPLQALGKSSNKLVDLHGGIGGSGVDDDLEHTAYVGTTFYRSPEMEEGSSGYYTDKVQLKK